MKGRARRFAFGAAVAGALGFGGAQALAAPAPVAAPAAACRDDVCYTLCVDVIGAIHGRCGDGGVCECYWR